MAECCCGGGSGSDSGSDSLEQPTCLGFFCDPTPSYDDLPSTVVWEILANASFYPNCTVPDLSPGFQMTLTKFYQPATILSPDISFGWRASIPASGCSPAYDTFTADFRIICFFPAPYVNMQVSWSSSTNPALVDIHTLSYLSYDMSSFSCNPIYASEGSNPQWSITE